VERRKPHSRKFAPSARPPATSAAKTTKERFQEALRTVAKAKPEPQQRKHSAAGIAATGATTPIRSIAVEPRLQDAAERRQVTVMLSDLVGSTAFLARMDDPEGLHVRLPTTDH
jgi:hypothetical protein